MDLARSPGLLTCNQNHNRGDLKGWGYDWQSYQVWNVSPRGPLDTGGDYRLSEDRAYGISPGVWGVVYERSEFYAAGKGTAERAVALDAEHLMLDIEECLKNTNPNGAQEAIRGVRDGGWSGPVHLTTLGCPSQNPSGGFWDYGMDIESFLETGGALLPQAYIGYGGGRSNDYAAELCVAYWCDQLHVPRGSLNLMIWPNGTNPIGVEVGHLQTAGLGCQMSVFLTETTTPESFGALEQITDLPPWGDPEPEPPSDIFAQMEQMTVNVKAEMEAMSATDPEAWIAQNPGECDEILRLCVYAAFSKPRTPKELKSHAGRASSGIAQNGVTSLQL